MPVAVVMDVPYLVANYVVAYDHGAYDKRQDEVQPM